MLAKVWERVADMIIERGRKLEAAVEFYKNSEKVVSIFPAKTGESLGMTAISWPSITDWLLTNYQSFCIVFHVF